MKTQIANRARRGWQTTTRWLIRGVVLPALLLGGCQTPKNSAPTSTGVPTWDHKSVELERSPDPEQARQETARQMAEFAREGWCILSLKSTTQADGSRRQHWRLRRLKQ